MLATISKGVRNASNNFFLTLCVWERDGVLMLYSDLNENVAAVGIEQVQRQIGVTFLY